MAASCECPWLACHVLFVRIFKRRFKRKFLAIVLSCMCVNSLMP